MVAYASEAEGNVDVWVVDAQGGDPLRLTDGPAVDRAPAWFPDGSAVAYLSVSDGRPAIRKVPRLGGQSVLLVADATDPAVSPDGTRIAFARPSAGGDMRIFVAPLADPEAARMVTTDGDGVWNHEQPAWSPDGTRLAYAAQNDLWVVPADGGSARRLTSDGEYDREPAWSADGRFVYFSSFREGTLALWRVPARGGPASRVTLGTGPESQPTLSADGTRLAYSTLLDTADLVVHDLATGTEHPIGDLRDEESPVFAPDGRSVVFVSDRRNGMVDLWLQPLSETGQPLGAARRLTDNPGTVAQPAFSPDGRWVAYHRVFEGQRDIWVVPVLGAAPVRFTGDAALDVHPDWSPDGRFLAWVSDRGRGQQPWIAPVANGRPAGPPRLLTAEPISFEAPAWSHDGSQIALVGFDRRGAAEVWVVGVNGGASRRITTGAQALRICWDWQRPGALLVAGFWGQPRLSVRRVAGDGSADYPPEIVAWMGTSRLRGDFDQSRDGRLLVFGRQDARGDVWILEAPRRRY
jgi:Tol biopolymer transport system component